MLQDLKDIVGFLYRFSSPFLIVSDGFSLLGYVRTEEILTLMNIGIEGIDKIVTELKLRNLNDIFNEDSLKDSLPMLILPQKDIDLISLDELKHFVRNEELKLNFETILINFPLPVIITDRFGNVIFVNSKLCDVFGVEKENFLGLSIDIFMDSSKKKVSIKDKSYNLLKSSIIAFNIKANIFVLY
ncbi:MAG: PAS domain S-box protein [Brevinematia bacterium]